MKMDSLPANRIKLVAALLFVLLGSLTAAGAPAKAYYFYQVGCTHCEAIDPLVQNITAKYGSSLEMTKLETRYNQNNSELFAKFVKAYNLSFMGTPTIFIGDNALVGDAEVSKRLDYEVSVCVEKGCPDALSLVDGTLDRQSFMPTWPQIITLLSLAAVDSINPCAFAVLVFLLGYITSIGSSKRAIRVAFVYIFAIFISYLLAGLGIRFFFDILSPFKIYIEIAVGIMAIAMGLVNVKDFFFYGKWFSLEIPKNQKNNIERYMKNSTIPGAFVLGFFVSAVELPCTGGAYLVAINMLTNYNFVSSIPWLALYNLVFIAPLVAIVALYYRGFSAESMESWREDHKRYMKLAMGLILVLAGLALALHLI